MKTTGKRIVHLYENVFKVTREDFARISGVSRSSLVNIENGEGKRSLEDLISNLKVNPIWVYEGKGPIFLKGSETENVMRIKSGKSEASENHYRDELVNELKRRAESAEAREQKLQGWLDRILNGNVNFLKPLGKASYARQA